MPLEDRNGELAVTVEVYSAPAEENAACMVTDFVRGCGYRRPILRESRTAKVERLSVAILHADGGYDSREAFSRCKRRGMRTAIHVRMYSNRKSYSKDSARSNAVLEQRKRRVRRHPVRQDRKGGTQETPEEVECQGQVQQTEPVRIPTTRTSGTPRPNTWEQVDCAHNPRSSVRWARPSGP